MWLIFIFFVEAYFYLRWLFFGRILVVFSLSIGYGLTYFSSSHRNGHRNWPWFRNLNIWKRIGRCSNKDWVSRDNILNSSQSKVFLVYPNLTGMALLWSMGLHVDEVLSRIESLWCCPPLWLKIPIIRDLLLWSGAVEDSYETMLYLLDHNISFAMSPGGLLNAIERQKPDGFTNHKLDMQIVRLFMNKRALLVPVYVDGQTYRYPLAPFMKSKFLTAIHEFQHIALQSTGHPFPMISGVRLRGMLFRINGMTIDTTQYKDESGVNTQIMNTVQGLPNATGI